MMSALKSLILLPLVFISFISSQEPSCYTTNRFEYEFNVLHKLDVLEQSRTELISISETLIEQMTALQNQLRGKYICMFISEQLFTLACLIIKCKLLTRVCLFVTLSEKDLEIEDLQTRLAFYIRMKDPGGSTYVRWGRMTCPETSELVYDGYAGGTNYAETGGGANYLCLPRDPDWAQEQSPTYLGYIHGAEYQTHGSVFDGNTDHDVPCAVCQTNSTNVLIIPAKQTCQTGWIREYSGFLMGERNSHASSKEFICMDGNPESLTGTYTDRNGALFHFQRSVCGSLPCPPYIDGRELTCVVCTK